MSTTRFLALIGLALGAVWALAGFGSAVLAGALALVSFGVGLVLEGRVNIDLGEVFARSRGSQT